LTVTDRETRKRASAEFKERKKRVGIFAVRCPATGKSWVGVSRTLDAARNRLWFTLRTGASYDADLLAEWRAHGEDAFTFEILEELDDDVPAMLEGDLLKSKLGEWAASEHAGVLLR
jgi:hypothetical protein